MLEQRRSGFGFERPLQSRALEARRSRVILGPISSEREQRFMDERPTVGAFTFRRASTSCLAASPRQLGCDSLSSRELLNKTVHGHVQRRKAKSTLSDIFSFPALARASCRAMLVTRAGAKLVRSLPGDETAAFDAGGSVPVGALVRQ